ncbi:Ldh family oxidoreductase [Saccharopolyspora sp. K220]|uniref:Ldh family oxidoreductase n=1 Tax=Saccharopolyspora soli TaxID=2926618 RepID=UPI001F593A15|nr:Ldh family oxidoreductase [Saccharopolyspora soli]MCI2418697.1 Ldh family oxidoreductase [Saccharopolyspora soli]
MTGDTRITADRLRALAGLALVAGGMSEEDARRAADVLVLADLFGIRTHGVARIAQYLDRARLGGVDVAAKVVVAQVTPALSRVDGANGIGPLVGSHALDAALVGARETGLGAAFVRGSNHFGPVMPYLFRAAEQGFAAIIASNATTTIAPWGGREARLGNNPLGIGVPAAAGDPVLLDIAMSVAARAKIRAAAAAGQSIPDTWATDRDGRPTSDPTAALDGFLQPLGGHKGYGLSVMVDLYAGLLSGAGYLTRISSWSEDPERPQNLGHVFFLIDTSKLLPAATLDERMADFAGILRSTPAADPAQPVRLPGELELARYHRQLRDGVAVDSEVLAQVSDLAGAQR